VLAQQKDKLKSMVESMSDGVFLIDQDFRLLVVNPACLSLLGIKKRSNVTVFDLVGAFDQGFHLEEMMGKVFDTGQTQTESEVKVKSGYLHVVAVPVEVDDGVKGVGVIIHDQSEEHELERLRENFTAIVIHELRSPLTVIRATSDLLVREYKSLKGEKISSLLDQIRTSSSGLLDIVNDLLDVAKIDAGKFDIVKKPADINSLLKNEILYYSNLAKEKGLDLIVTTNESIEPFPFDYQKITQVLNNLLSNAIKFTEKGKIIVRSSVDGEMVKVSVEDTGRGIPEELKPRLFNKFTQIRESNKSNEKGTGLGLVVAKGIVEEHGGSIWVEDNDTSGSVFVFTLPMK
jgi:two-component system sensor histidine kinase ResE